MVLGLLHRFWDTATYWSKIAHFCYPSFIRSPRSLCSFWNFAVKLTTRKLQSVQASIGLQWRPHDHKLARVVLICYGTVTDRRTDGFTIASTELCSSKLCWRAVKSLKTLTSSATAEKQRVSCVCLPRLANWSCSAQNTAESKRLYYFWHSNALIQDSRADRKRILSWNSHSRSFILQSFAGRQGVAYRHTILLV